MRGVSSIPAAFADSKTLSACSWLNLCLSITRRTKDVFINGSFILKRRAGFISVFSGFFIAAKGFAQSRSYALPLLR